MVWMFFCFAAGKSERIAVVGLEARDVPTAIVSAVEETVAAEAAMSSKLAVSSPSTLRSFITLSEKKQMLGCAGADCLGEASRLLDADLMLSGAIIKSGDGYYLTLILNDIRRHATIKRVSRQLPSDVTRIGVPVRALTAALFGVVGKIAIWNQPNDAEVYVDGRFVGPTPVPPVLLDSPGAHRVEISGPGVTTWTRDVSVDDGVTQRLRAGNVSFNELARQASIQRWTAIGVGAAGLLSAIASGTLFGLAVQNDRQLDSLNLRATPQNELDAITGRTLGYTIGGSAALVATAALAGVALYLWLDNPAAKQLARQGILTW